MRKATPNRPIVTVKVWPSKLLFYHNSTREEVSLFLVKRGMVNTTSAPKNEKEFQFV